MQSMSRILNDRSHLDRLWSYQFARIEQFRLHYLILVFLAQHDAPVNKMKLGIRLPPYANQLNMPWLQPSCSLVINQHQRISIVGEGRCKFVIAMACWLEFLVVGCGRLRVK